MPIESIKEASPQSKSPVEGGPKRVDQKKLEKACLDFESVFLLQMLKSMRRTIPKTGFLGEGQEKQIMESLFDEELSKQVAKRGGLGLGKMLYRQMVKERERIPTLPTASTLPGPDNGLGVPSGRE